MDSVSSRIISHLDFARVTSVSGAAQQHAILLLSESYTSVCNSSLNPTLPLAKQVSPILASPYATNWQDSSTTKECHAMESDLFASASNANKLDGPGLMAAITGSSAHERFSGPQLKKIYKARESDDYWQKTAHVALLSSFLTSLICADGQVKGIDEVKSSLRWQIVFLMTAY